MRIHMVNFRCYKDRTFDLGGDKFKFVLISGQSGHGKSSIFLAIYFALFGVGKKLAMHGKKSCFVELDFGDINIVRTKGPNMLILRQAGLPSLEDDAAQEVINRIFGEAFDVTSYIPQNSMKSFVMMSPIEKITFLEKFAFKDTNLVDIKSKNKALITKTHDEFKRVSTQLETSVNILNDIPRPDPVSFPIKCKPSQIELAIKNQHVKLKNSGILLRRYKDQLSKLQAELHDLDVYHASVHTRQESLVNAYKEQTRIETEISGIEYVGDESLEKMEKKMLAIKLYQNIQELESKIEVDKQELDRIKQEEIDQVRSRIGEIDNSMYSEYSKDELLIEKQNLEEFIEDQKTLRNIQKELTRISTTKQTAETHANELAQLEQTLNSKTKLLEKLAFQSEIRQCPSCMCKLRFVNSSLILVKGDSSDSDDIPKVTKTQLEREISKLTTQVSTLRKTVSAEQAELARIESLESQSNSIQNKYEEPISTTDLPNNIKRLAYLVNYEREQEELTKEKINLENKLQNQVFSVTCKRMSENLVKSQAKLDRLKTNINKQELDSLDEIPDSEQELAELILTQKSNKKSLEKLVSSKAELLNSIQSIESKIDELSNTHTSKYEEIRESDGIKDKISDINEKIESESNNQENLTRIISEIEAWKVYKARMDSITNLENTIKDLEKQEKVARNKYGAATQLKEVILEAESIAIQKVIESINCHASIYLDTFFPDNPIMVQMVPFKESKKGNVKPQVNILVEYKGSECDIASLSGGEQSRVILAYTLALAEIFSSPLLLIDEATASLDKDSTQIVFESIRENFPGKNVLIIAHQVVEGSFDKVIDLDGSDVDTSTKVSNTKNTKTIEKNTKKKIIKKK